MNSYIYGWEHIICWNFETWGSCLYIRVSAHPHTPTSNNNKKTLHNDAHRYIHNRALAIYTGLGLRPSRGIATWPPPGGTLLRRAPHGPTPRNVLWNISIYIGGTFLQLVFKFWILVLPHIVKFAPAIKPSWFAYFRARNPQMWYPG